MSKEFICKGCGEKFNKDMQSSNVDYCYICNEFYMKKYVADLETKLAEAQKTIEIQRMSNDALKEENIDKAYDITDLALERAKDIAEDWEFGYQEEIKELKQQLAEKDKEIAELNDKLKWKSEWLKIADNMVGRYKKSNQDKISFAVEQLEKILPSIKATIELAENRHQMKDQVDIIIDNQINELKKEMK